MKEIICLLCFIIFNYKLNSVGFNLSNKSASFKISSGSNFVLNSSINAVSGKIVQESGAAISGNNINFTSGSFYDGDSKIKISGTMNFGELKSIILDGGKNFEGKRGDILQSISISGSDNVLEGVLFTVQDINLADSNSGVLISLRNRLDANINLNNGTLNIDEDLFFLDGKRIVGPGKVNISGHKLSFGSKDLVWQEPILFEEASDVDLNANVTLENTWSFRGLSVCRGNANILNLSCDDCFVVRPNSNLLIHDLILYGLSDNKIRCLTDTSTITLRNVKLIQSGNFTFTRGTLVFADYVEFVGNGKTITYQSAMPCIIKQNAVVYFDTGFTFSYAPITNNRKLIQFEDDTATIYLNGANLYSSYVGMDLIGGNLIVNKNSNIFIKEYDYSTGISGQIQVGTGGTGKDFKIHILSGSQLNVDTGYFVYNNVSASSFNAINNSSFFKFGNSARLNLEQPLNMSLGRMFIGNSLTNVITNTYNLSGMIFSY